MALACDSRLGDRPLLSEPHPSIAWLAGGSYDWLDEVCDWGRGKCTYSLTDEPGEKGTFLIFVTRKFSPKAPTDPWSTVQRRPLGLSIVLNWALYWPPVETNECALVRCRVGIMTYIQQE